MFRCWPAGGGDGQREEVTVPFSREDRITLFRPGSMPIFAAQPDSIDHQMPQMCDGCLGNSASSKQRVSGDPISQSGTAYSSSFAARNPKSICKKNSPGKNASQVPEFSQLPPFRGLANLSIFVRCPMSNERSTP